MKCTSFTCMLLLLAILGAASLYSCKSAQNVTPVAKVQVPSEPSRSESEQAAPAIPLGTVISSLDNIRFLRLLCGPYNDKFDGAATVIQSIDLQHNGAKRHFFLSNLSRGLNQPPLLSAHSFSLSDGKWTCDANYEHLEKVVKYWPHSDVHLVQIGGSDIAIEETGIFSDETSKPASFVTLYTLAPSGWRQALNVSHVGEKNESIKIEVAFKKSKSRFWPALVKTTFNHGKPVVVRYLMEDGSYVAAGTVPAMTVIEALHTRGVPSTDWDGN